jgi:hypothetical protein
MSACTCSQLREPAPATAPTCAVAGTVPLISHAASAKIVAERAMRRVAARVSRCLLHFRLESRNVVGRPKAIVGPRAPRRRGAVHRTESA